MDKLDKEKKVTIKINGKEREFHEDKGLSIHEPQDEAAAVESSDESFDWILPNEITPSPKSRKGKFPYKNRHLNLKTPIILTIVAILFGTTIGLFVIKTITAEKTTTEPVNQNLNIPTIAPTASSSDKKSITIQTFFVQGGVLSTNDAAKEVQASIHGKNLPAEVFRIDNSYYVFLGAAENLEAAKELALMYKKNDIDVFWKEMNFSTNLMKDDSITKELLSIYTSLVDLSSAKLRNVDSNVDIHKVSQQIHLLQIENNDAKERLLEAAQGLQNNNPTEAQAKLLLFLQAIKK